MLVLFETSVGFALFRLADEKKLKNVDKLFSEFETPAKASKVVSLAHFEKFKDSTEAVTATSALIEGKMSKKLKKTLKKITGKETEETFAVADSALARTIKEKFGVNCQSGDAVDKLMTCIRGQISSLVPEWNPEEEAAMQLAISHGLGRYKLKFSPDKVDTMIIQAVSLLDDVDKELNNYVMRCKEWYGWHFPELVKIVSDSTAFIRTMLAIGMKTSAVETDLSDILPEDVEAKVKEMAEVSMGSEISEEDLLNIRDLGQNVLELQEYRQHLYEYLKKRMMAIAPNLTILVGEVVGARLISHAGSLINLAKHPASTVQILGAEKALFRALKARHDTPKYGLIYHAQLVGQSNPKIKGKMSRMLAAKASLATRVDALGDDPGNELGIEHRGKLESKLRFLEEGGIRRISGTGKGKASTEKYQHKSNVMPYKPASDSTIPISSSGPETEGESTPRLSKKEKKKLKKQQEEEVSQEEPAEVSQEEQEEVSEGKKKKKAKKRKLEGEDVPETTSAPEEEQEGESSVKKKKKKAKKVEAVESD